MVKTTGRVQQIGFLMMVAGALLFLCWPQRTAPPAYAQGSPVIHQESEVVSGGSGHTCAITSDGGVQCWGNNASGQLGDGTTTSSKMPVAVTGLSRGVAAIAASGNHTCALTTAGSVLCWGWNWYGQLGDGTTTLAKTPVAVSGLGSDVAAIAASGNHTCALTTAGSVLCWGNNVLGQLGDSTTTSAKTPVAVTGLSRGVAAIAAGDFHTCALTTTDGIQCWGANHSGQLGDGTTISAKTPVVVKGVNSDVVAIAAGDSHTCALTTAGGVKCWGANGYGQLGDGTTTSAKIAVVVAGLSSGVAAIAAGDSHTCALTTAGGVQCWGANGFGQLGDGTNTSAKMPVAVSGLGNGVVALTAGDSHTCALTTTGGAQCWGANGFGQLGDGTGGSAKMPVAVSGLNSGIVVIASGYGYTCALTAVGSVLCWGDNGYGQLGDGTTISMKTPVAVNGLSSGVTAIAAGDSHTCALTTAGGVLCWGWNGYGQLGSGTTTSAKMPVAVSGLSSGVTAIAAGNSHMCVLTTTGGVQCWGNNASGQLGDGTTTSAKMPVAVSGLGSGVMAIAAGYEFTCALTATGGVLCWGNNNYGKLGDGTTTSAKTPVAVSGLSSGMMAIATGGSHTCALTMAGSVLCWGNNDYGQLGDGTTISAQTPVAVSGLGSSVTAIVVGSFHTCALTTTAGVLCWGNNVSSQLGDGTTTSAKMPVAVSGLDNGVAAIATGGSHTCALTTAGGVLCWGANGYGQLGDGNAWCTTPVDVFFFSGQVPGDITPTPTLTPTPSPVSTVEPVILIPGITGSQLRRNILGHAEYLWPAYFDNGKLKMSLKPGERDNSIYTDDVIRAYDAFYVPFGVFHNPVYGPFIERLKTAGYVEYKTGGNPEKRRLSDCDTSQANATLFIFPWDWRFGVENAVDPALSLEPNNITLLREYIECVRKIHSNAQVTLITHSMGGLLGRNYVLTYPNDHYVKRHIAIAAPWLGAPKALSAMLTGDFMTDLIDTDTAKILLEYFPGGHQLLPSQKYFELLSESSLYPLALRDASILNPALQYVSYDELPQKLKDNFRSPAENEAYRSSINFIGNNAKLHGKTLFADWRGTGADFGVDYHILYGVQSEANTIEQVFQKWCNGFFADLHRCYDTKKTQGDGTVPVLSASRIGKGQNLNGTAELYRFAQEDRFDDVEHSAMVSNERVQDCVLGLLNGSSYFCPSSFVLSANAASQPFRRIKLWGITSLQVTDGISTTTNLITNSLSLGMFADITMDHLGSDAVELTIINDKVYTITFSTGSDYFENESTYNIGGSTQQVVRYVASQLLSDTNASLISLASDIASITVDTNNDTVPDTSIAPLANLSGESVQDNEAPIVTGTYLTVTQEVVLSASDNKSGVLAISYSLDNGVTFVSYSKPFQVAPNNVAVVKAIAQDKVGNWSTVVHINIPKPSSSLQFTLDLVSIGQGTVSYDRAGPYPSGTQVQLTAMPAVGWRFVRWESTVALGDQATQSIITITVTGDATYTAHFELDTLPPPTNSIYLPLVTR